MDPAGLVPGQGTEEEMVLTPVLPIVSLVREGRGPLVRLHCRRALGSSLTLKSWDQGLRV